MTTEKLFGVRPVFWMAGLALGLTASAGASPEKAAAPPSAWSALTTIPWGDGHGKLKQEIDSKNERQVYRGPTRLLAYSGGRFAVLDTLGGAIREYTAEGKPQRDLALPTTDEHDAELLCIDMTSDGQGNYWLLTLPEQEVLRVSPFGKNQNYKLNGLTKSALLMGLTRDGRGALYVLDGYDGSAYRMTADGKPLDAVKDQTLQSLTCDSKGRFYDLRLAKGQDPHHYELVRWASGGKPEVLADVRSASEIERIDVFGVDTAGNIYATIACGAIELQNKVELVRWASSGKETGRVACPADPTLLKFVHGKAVSPDGIVYALEVDNEGLHVLKLKGF